MNLHGIRAVAFDAVGTLIHPSPPAAEVYAAVGTRYGSPLDADTIRARFRDALRTEDAIDERADWVTSEAREERRWRAVVDRVFAEVLPPEARAACFAELFAHFARPEAWTVSPGLSALLAQIGDRGAGVASNFDARLHAVLDGFPELAPLRWQAVSSEIGYRKPHPLFFAAVVRLAGCEPGEILFVGDDARNDIEGATRAGMRAERMRDEG